MSTLTKVFVLLLAVSSIALSMLVVGAFARQQDWKQSATDWRQTALYSATKEGQVSANAQLQHQRDLDQHQRDVEQIARLKANKLDLDTQLGESSRTLTDLRNKLALEQATVVTLSDASRLSAASHGRTGDRAEMLSRRNSELELRNVDLNDRVEELSSNMAMAAMQVRALQHQITAIAESRDSVARGLRPATQIPGGPGIVEPRTPLVRTGSISGMAVPIRGEITDVVGNIASISVGSTDGVAPGMTFLVYRRQEDKAQYLGTLRVDRVEANQSVGTIEKSVGFIQPGDSARDEASFAMRY